MSEIGHSSVRSEPPDDQNWVGPRPKSRTLVIFLAGLFAVFVLVISILVGSLLGDIASDFALRKTLPDMSVNFQVPPSPDSETLTSGAQQTAAPQNDQSPALSAEAPAQERQINILLLGSDERIDGVEPPRTDTMLLLTLDLRRQTAGMISLPRDLWVPIPGYNLTSKINTAYAIGEQRGYPLGGPQLAKDTVSSFIGQPVQFYLQADFNGFVRFVDEIGGVTINVPQTIHDPEYPTSDYGYQTFHLEAGQHTLDGQTALKYARTRNMDSDYGRAARQQQLIQAIVDKVFAADMLPTLIARAPQLVNAAWGSVRTDMPLSTATEIAYYVSNNPFDLRTLVLDDRYGVESYSEHGAWILLPNRELIRPELKAFFDPVPGAIAGVGESTDPPPQIQPLARADTEIPSTDLPATALKANLRVMTAREARLEILNGTSCVGVAARVRRELEANGWQVVSIGDADRTDYLHTLLVNYNTHESLVQELSRQLNLITSLYTLPGLLIPDSTDLRIVIGEDYLENPCP